LDRTSEFLRVVRERAGAGVRAERFDAVRVVRSCLTLEGRLLRDRGIDLDFTTALEATYLKGDPNALFDLLVNLIRTAADSGAKATAGAVRPRRAAHPGREAVCACGYCRPVRAAIRFQGGRDTARCRFHRDRANTPLR